MAERIWLRKSGTEETFVWTPTLAQRTDMEPISQEEVDVLRKKELEEGMARAEIAKIKGPIEAGKTEEKKAVVLEEMKEDDLRALAVKHKVFVKQGTKKETIIKKLKAVLEPEAK